jgi:membrane protease YdiL (CAAX protease family)
VLPIFLGYHLGVVFLPTRNAVDFVTDKLVSLANNSILTYTGFTFAIGAVLIITLMVLGRGRRLSWSRFVLVALEGVVYAALVKMAASYVVGSLRLAPAAEVHGIFSGTVSSFGAGLYEELVFRVGLFGIGYALISKFGVPKRVVLGISWAVITSLVFSAWHYIGPYGDPFELSSFVFRAVCGLIFVAVYKFRGFAPVVWTHALYDVWVLAL